MCAMAIVAGEADLDSAAEVGFDIELPVFSVGAAGSFERFQDAAPVRSLGRTATYGRWRATLFAARHLPPSRKRNRPARRRASTWLESRASSNLRKRTATAAPPSGAAAQAGRFQACSPRTRTVASWKSSGPSARACSAGSCEPMHSSFRRANPYRRNVRKRGRYGSRSVVVWGIR